MEKEEERDGEGGKKKLFNCISLSLSHLPSPISTLLSNGREDISHKETNSLRVCSKLIRFNESTDLSNVTFTGFSDMHRESSSLKRSVIISGWE